MSAQLLFSNADIISVLQRQEHELRKEVDRLDSQKLQQASEQELVHTLSAQHKLEVPTLEEDKAYSEYREVDIDVSGDPMSAIFYGGGSPSVKGTEFTFSLPFRGDGNLFYVRPQTVSSGRPRAEIEGQEIKLTYRRADNNGQALKADYERDLASIKQHLNWLQASVSAFNSKIGAQLQTLINERKLKIAATASMIDNIGLPVRHHTGQERPARVLATKAMSKGTDSTKKWDIFISHATEDKDAIARPLAEALQNRGVAVWYDEFSLSLGVSLRGSIDFGLANSRYGVVILSPHFFEKHWPQQELNGLSTREANGKKVILPIWHGVKFEDVRNFSPTLADRLAACSDIGIDALVEQIIGVLEQD